MNIYRYDNVLHIRTNLDPLTDLVTWLEYYCAIDYLVDILTSRHGIPAGEAKKRARLIGPHARLARDYIDQALTGPRDVAFLPSYYGILNLLKIAICLVHTTRSCPLIDGTARLTRRMARTAKRCSLIALLLSVAGPYHFFIRPSLVPR
jgi:hypothetical protein